MVKERGGYNNNNYNENKDLLDALMKMKRDAAKDGEGIYNLQHYADKFILGIKTRQTR